MLKSLNKISKKRQKEAGFTMLELAVVLTVVAMIAGGGLSVASSRIEAAKYNATEERIEFLMNTIDLYVDANCRLPCPADPALVNTDDGLGREEDDSEGAATDACVVGGGMVSGGSGVIGGAVPARELQVSPVLMLDGWGRRFLYVIDSDLSPAGDFYTGSPNIIILPATGGTEITSTAALAIISHGPNGHGAWRGKGVSRLDKDSPDADEVANSYNGNGVTGDGGFDNSFIQKFVTTTFDDVVAYRMRWQLPECTP